MDIEEARRIQAGSEARLLRLLIGILRLKGQERLDAGYRDAESMLKSCNLLVYKHNKEMDKLLDSVPE